VTTIEVFDDRLAHVVRDVVSLERLCTGAIWSEGPVWISEDDSVLWSEIPNNRMLRKCASDSMTTIENAPIVTDSIVRNVRNRCPRSVRNASRALSIIS